MQVELLSTGGYVGLEACIGKQFDVLHPDGNSNGSVRLDVVQLRLAGYVDDGSNMNSLYFFEWEVRRIDG